jgi:hypothetical protein
MNNSMNQQGDDVLGFGTLSGGVAGPVVGPQPILRLREPGEQTPSQPVTPLGSKLGSGTEG